MDEFASYRIPAENPSIDTLEPTIGCSAPVEELSRTDEPCGIRGKENGKTGKTKGQQKVKRRALSLCDKSMYAVFFRQQQPLIKALNPSATFGEVSRLIAAAWERVDDDQKRALKQASTAAKKAEMRRKIAMRTVQLCGIGDG